MVVEIAAVSVAVLHSLAPDHYLPITALGKARKWSLKKTLFLAFLVSTIHVSFSIVIGVFTYLGLNLIGFAERIENSIPLLLIIFGLTYALISLFKPHHHAHSATTTSLLLILGLSPCIPLIPIMLAASSVHQMFIVAVLFSAFTIGTIVTLTYLSYKAIKPPELHGKEDVFGGVIIAITGAISYLLTRKIGSFNVKTPEAVKYELHIQAS